MKNKLKFLEFVFYLLIVLNILSCKESAKQENEGLKTEKIVKQNSPLDEQKKVKSRQLTAELIKHFNFIPDTEEFAKILTRFKENHLFVNADIQGYIIVAASNRAFKQISENERGKLLDASGNNDAYRLKFLLHHIFSRPRQTFNTLLCRSLAGQNITISEDRSAIGVNDKVVRINSSTKVSDELEIISIDQVLFQ